MQPILTDSSQYEDTVLSRLPPKHVRSTGSSVWMHELQSLLPSLTLDQQCCILEFAFWSPAGVWDDYILPLATADSASTTAHHHVLCELEKRHLIERACDPFIVNRSGHSMWRITGGGHDADRLLRYHIQTLPQGETSPIFKKVFNAVIRRFHRRDPRHVHRPVSPRLATDFAVEAWESFPHAARLIKIITEADFHKAFLGHGDDAVRMMLEVVWLTSCIETMDELLAQGVFPQRDTAEIVSPSDVTRFDDQVALVTTGV